MITISSISEMQGIVYNWMLQFTFVTELSVRAGDHIARPACTSCLIEISLHPFWVGQVTAHLMSRAMAAPGLMRKFSKRTCESSYKVWLQKHKWLQTVGQ